MAETRGVSDAVDLAETDIAIVGMAGHFPGAPDVDVLWDRVEQGRGLPHRSRRR